MVVCNHASNVTGNVIDLEWIKAFCKAHSLLLVIDVSQTAGAYPIDLSDDIITAVCFTGHKALGGPGGTGGVCIKRDLEILPFMTGGDGTHSFSHTQPAAIPGVFEAGTMNVIGIIGLAAGIQYLLSSGIEKISAGQRKLSQAFLQPLRTIPGITLYGDFTGPRVSVFSLNVKDAESALVSDILWEEYSIATRSGYHCAPLMHEALGTKEQGTVRFSFSNYTTIAEIDLAIAALRDIAGR
jgi:selenocysteine lyase/cysteine desulfurase